MHFHLHDAHIETGSLIHRLDPRIKIIMTVSIILLISLTPMGKFTAYVAFFAFAMMLAVLAKIDPLLVIRRSLVAFVFAGAAVTLIFTVPGDSIGSVPLLGWPISEPGIIRFASILFKSLVSVQLAVLLSATTQFSDLLWALGALRIPRILVAIISFMYRYIFVMAEEAIRLTRARDSRSAILPGGKRPSLAFRARTTGRMIGNLLVRSFGRSERVYQAMIARGYQGEMRVLDPPKLQDRDIFLGIAALLYGLIVVFFSLI